MSASRLKRNKTNSLEYQRIRETTHKQEIYLRTYFPEMGENSKKILPLGSLKSLEECGQKKKQHSRTHTKEPNKPAKAGFTILCFKINNSFYDKFLQYCCLLHNMQLFNE